MLHIEPAGGVGVGESANKPVRRVRRTLAFEAALAPLTGTRRRIVAPSLRRRSKTHRDKDHQQLAGIEGGNPMLSVTTPRFASSSPQEVSRQVSPDFLITTRPPGGGANGNQQQSSIAVATVPNDPSGSTLPPIGRGLPSRSSPSTSRQRTNALSPYASAPQGLLPQLQTLPGAPTTRAARSPGVPISPTTRYRVSPRSSPPLMVHSSPPALRHTPSTSSSRTARRQPLAWARHQRLCAAPHHGHLRTHHLAGEAAPPRAEQAAQEERAARRRRCRPPSPSLRSTAPPRSAGSRCHRRRSRRRRRRRPAATAGKPALASIPTGKQVAHAPAATAAVGGEGGDEPAASAVDTVVPVAAAGPDAAGAGTSGGPARAPPPARRRRPTPPSAPISRRRRRRRPSWRRPCLKARWGRCSSRRTRV